LKSCPFGQLFYCRKKRERSAKNNLEALGMRLSIVLLLKAFVPYSVSCLKTYKLEKLTQQIYASCPSEYFRKQQKSSIKA